MVEEAGSILEGQVLANLFPSIEHLILIGDVNHRPRISNQGALHPECSSGVLDDDLALSRDQPRSLGLDRSLMERLSSNGFPVSELRETKNRTCEHPRSHDSFDDCEPCAHEILDVPLPCGHVAPFIPW